MLNDDGVQEDFTHLLNEAKIQYLGSFNELNITECLNRKLDLLVEGQLGISDPLSISLVIPTKIDITEKMREVELTAMRLVLSECSTLVDLGYIDEIIILDGSRDERGNANYHVLNRVVETAYDALDLFKKQIQLLNDNKAQALMANRGFFNFILKTVHQSDPIIFEICKKFGRNITGLKRIPMGKGAALWLSIPLTRGDVVCFVDSDIMNFTKEFVIALCHPIIRRWHNSRSRIRMVKACYHRLTLNVETIGPNYCFGGRVTRLFALPMLRVLSKNNPTIFGGLNSLKYPLSGEFAIQRDLLEKLSFPNDYSIELAMLKQVAALVGFTSTAQVDLKIFHHIGQSTTSLKRMVTQITHYIINVLEKEDDKFSESVWKRMVTEYKNEGEKLLSEYEEFFTTNTNIARDLNGKSSYSKEGDIEMFHEFYKLLDDAFSRTAHNQQIVLPSWEEMSSKANYFVVSTLLRRRGNQSTFYRLKDTGLFYGLHAIQ